MPLPTFTPVSSSVDSHRLVDAPQILAPPTRMRPGRWTLLRESVQDMPSWMTSLVVHLLCFFLFMTLTSRPSSSAGGAPLVLQLSLGEELATTSVMEVAEPQSHESNGNSNDLPDGLEDTVQPPENANSSSQESESQEDSRSERRMAFKSPMYRAPDAPSKYAALTNRLRNRTSRTPFDSSVDNRSKDPIQRRFDTVVDRFIQYDIGKLGGQEGLQANREFHKLGREAFPALVRGLNRSASIHASCPVGVIAGKILSVLRNSDDPSLAGFAARHIGEGVSSSAPHYGRIVALRDRYVGNVQVIPSRVSAMLSERGLAGDGETFELALGLAESPVQTLAAALRSADEDLAIPATIALLQRMPRMTKMEKSQALRTLGTRELDNASEDCKSLMQETIAALRTDLAAMRRRQQRANQARVHGTLDAPSSGPLDGIRTQSPPAPHRLPVNPYQRPY